MYYRFLHIIRCDTRYVESSLLYSVTNSVYCCTLLLFDVIER